MNKDAVKLLFIGGYGRSGSTLLEQILGQIDGFFPVGEIRYIWDRSFAQNQLCSCGAKFSRCDFWRAVVDRAFGGWNNLDFNEIRALKDRVDRKRFIPMMAMPMLRTSVFEKALAAYSQVLLRLYTAISKVSGCRVIIDSSKNPSHGFLLNTLKNIDLYVIHLVRDSRAVAYSWLRKKIRPEIHWKKQTMPIHSIMKSSVEWLALNMLTQSMMYFNSNYIVKRYEDFVAELNLSLKEISEYLNENEPDLSIKSNCIYNIVKAHTVSGNPIRFMGNEIKVRPDREWQRKMPKGKRAAVSCLTWPLLCRYRYPLSVRSERGYENISA